MYINNLSHHKIYQYYDGSGIVRSVFKYTDVLLLILLYFQKNNDKGQDDKLQEDDNIDQVDAIIPGQALPLKNGMGFLRRRRKGAIIRYFQNNKEDIEQQVKTTMLLFHPFRNEQRDVHKNSDIVKKYEKFQDLVDCERQLFEPNPNFMEELNNIRIEDNESDEDEEQMEQEEEETVTNKEFQNMLKTKTYNGDKTYRMQDRKNLNNKINTLNKEQRKIFDEMLDIREDKQTFLYLYGKAGTGKTYLLNTIIPALEFKSLKSGIDLSKPLVLVMSPTAAAAKHLLYGDTIHGSLRLTSFQNLEQQMVHGANAKLSSELCQLKYVIIDEISMVGSEFLWDINQRLKQIMGSDKYFGGLNVIATGDFHQLAPIKKSWIFQQT